MCAVSAIAIVWSVKKIKKDDLCEKKIPVMGVMGAFIFAAQMINFTIPLTGSSGHIGGGILLAAMIGGFPALISMSAALIIQCLFFADGGLLAIGCNIFNLGVIPCLIVYPLLFKPLVKNGFTFGRITIASVAAVIIALQLGAFAVVLETLLSGITKIPFLTFTFLMQPIHLAIGLAEGIITAAVLSFVYKARPEIIESSFDRKAINNDVITRKIVIMLAVITLFAGGILSLFASSYPDGLEWAVEKVTGGTEPEVSGYIVEGAVSIQKKVSVMPGYNFKDTEIEGSKAGTAASGIAGGIITFLLAGVSAFAISLVKRKQKNSAVVSLR
jgi:cobalt/nickel transport system permease protein